MSHMTDDFRAPVRDAQPYITVPGNTLEEIIHANPSRRTVLKNTAALASVISMGGLLTACGDDTATAATPPPPVTTTPPPPAISFAADFTAVARNADDTVTVPAGYRSTTLFTAGQAVTPGAPSWNGAFQTSVETERQAGGNHDGMAYFAIPGVDPNTRGLLAINHELPDFNILFPGSAYNPATATEEQKRIALSAVGVSVIEVAKQANGSWATVPTSPFNKRYTGNTEYRVGGPAVGVVGQTVIGTLNNCAHGTTPWGTYLTCEETTDNYLNPARPESGYGWVLEIDPLGQLNNGVGTKRTALGRFDHENADFLTDSSNRVAFYMGDDSTPGCIYKFVPTAAFNPNDRGANANLLDVGTLYVARFNANGTGEWRALVQGQNGLVVGASDPGNVVQGPQTPRTVNFATQADVLMDTKAAARIAGGTTMDRPEWISVAPNKQIYVTLTNNSSRAVTDAANPRIQNRHGHIIRFKETNESPLATTFTWELFLLAGDPALTNAAGNLTGNISGDTFSSPDGIWVDREGRLWVQTDMSVPGASGVSGITNVAAFGHNAMYYVDPTTKRSKRFLVGPTGCEITGMTSTPDLTTFFINIQHPTGNWPEQGKAPRSSTIVVQRTDGKPVGA